MSYVVIENENLFPLEALTLAGFTTKREDSNTIGQFGTGRIFASILSLRLGISLFIQTKAWIATPFSKPIYINKGDQEYYNEQVCFRVTYADGSEEIRETSFTTDMGLGWTTPFQLFREFYINAYDETLKIPHISLKKDVIPCIKVDDGKTLVYIKNVDKIKEITRNLSYFFPFKAPTLYKNGYGEIIGVQNGKQAGVYVKRVLVMPLKKAIFSYNFEDLQLNEERSIKDVFDMTWRIQALFRSCDDLGILVQVLDSMSKKEYFEFSQANVHDIYIDEWYRESWSRAFQYKFGNEAVVSTGAFSETMASEMGYNPVKVPKQFLEFVSMFAKTDEQVWKRKLKSEGMNKMQEMAQKDITNFLLKGKEIVRITGLFLDSTIDTQIDLDEKLEEEVKIEHGIIAINPKYIATQNDMVRTLIRAYIMLDKSVDYREERYTYALEDLTVEMTNQLNAVNTVSEAQQAKKVKFEYEADKNKWYIPMNLIDASNPAVFVSVANGSAMFSSGEKGQEKSWRTSNVSDDTKMFTRKIIVSFDTKKASYIVKPPKNLTEIIDFTFAEFIVSGE